MHGSLFWVTEDEAYVYGYPTDDESLPENLCNYSVVLMIFVVLHKKREGIRGQSPREAGQ